VRGQPGTAFALCAGWEDWKVTRIRAITTIGTLVSAAGLFLCLRASDLATNWQRTQSGDGWGGRTDPALQHSYFTLGLVAFCFGLVLLGAAAWAWLTCGGATSHRPSIEM
jgi:hypothetical protein